MHFRLADNSDISFCANRKLISRTKLKFCKPVMSTHRIWRTWFRCTFSENLLWRNWAQISIFLNRNQVGLILCSKATKIILNLSSIWVFFLTHRVNDENKYSIYKGGFRYLDSVCRNVIKSISICCCTWSSSYFPVSIMLWHPSSSVPAILEYKSRCTPDSHTYRAKYWSVIHSVHLSGFEKTGYLPVWDK